MMSRNRWRPADRIQGAGGVSEKTSSSGDGLDRLKEMFEQAPGAKAILRGPEHVFEMVNPAYLQLIGHRDVLGKPLRQALPEIVGQGFADLLDDVRLSGEAHVGKGVTV